MYWGGTECRYSGARRGIGGTRGHLWDPSGCWGYWGVRVYWGAGTECRYSGDRRVIGAFGCSYGVLGPLGDIRGVFGAGSGYRWHKGAFWGS